jgi:branched-chain amino acid transport system ATP-binding protein
VSALLQLDRVEARYGPVKALHGISLEVGEGELVAVLGANGAGKTTTLRAVSGTVRRSGDVIFDDKKLPRRPGAAARAGIAHVPEGRGTFSELSVWENLRLGAYTRRGGIKDDAQRVFKYFPRLEERKGQQAGTLSGGEQQMLALGRAMVARPKLVLLDEPSLGLAPMVVRDIFRIVRAINQEQGVSVLLVEQNASIALELADHAYLLETGRVVMSGPAERLRNDEAVRRSYLGY